MLFALAVIHTFCVKKFAYWAHKYPSGSIQENVLHFLAETELIFGVWAAALFVGTANLSRGESDVGGHFLWPWDAGLRQKIRP